MRNRGDRVLVDPGKNIKVRNGYNLHFIAEKNIRIKLVNANISQGFCFGTH